MTQQSPYAIALDLLREWDDGNSHAFDNYAARYPDASHEVIDLVADCLILDALALPGSRPAAAAHG